MWHLKNKSIINASAKHYSSFAKCGVWISLRTHKLTHITNHILKVSTIWIAVARWNYLGMHTMQKVDHKCQIGAALYIMLLSSCLQWEDEMVWARLETQIDGAARLMKICSEHAGRQAVQYIGMCHNA